MVYWRDNNNKKLIIQKRERGIKSKRNKWYNTVVHPVPTLLHMTAPSLSPGHDILRYGISLWPFGSAVLAVLPPGFSCTCSLVKHGKLESLGFRVSITWQQPKHQCNNLILIPNHSTVRGTKKIISNPDEISYTLVIPVCSALKEILKKCTSTTEDGVFCFFVRGSWEDTSEAQRLA